MPEQVPNYAALPFTLGGPSVVFPGVTTPNNGDSSLLTAVTTLKEISEILTRQRGRVDDSAVLVSELKALWAATSIDFRNIAIAYLKLDASNGPITAPLGIQGAITHTGRIENINVIPKISNYTLTVDDDNVVCNTSAGAFSVFLPPTPELGRVYTIVLATAGNDLTIDGNGNNIFHDTTATLNRTGDAIQCVYNGIQWELK